MSVFFSSIYEKGLWWIYGTTIVHEYCKNPSDRTLDYLLSRGLTRARDWNVRDSIGNTPLDYAKVQNDPQPLNYCFRLMARDSLNREMKKSEEIKQKYLFFKAEQYAQPYCEFEEIEALLQEYSENSNKQVIIDFTNKIFNQEKILLIKKLKDKGFFVKLNEKDLIKLINFTGSSVLDILDIFDISGEIVFSKSFSEVINETGKGSLLVFFMNQAKDSLKYRNIDTLSQRFRDIINYFIQYPRQDQEDIKDILLTLDKEKITVDNIEKELRKIANKRGKDLVNCLLRRTIFVWSSPNEIEYTKNAKTEEIIVRRKTVDICEDTFLQACEHKVVDKLVKVLPLLRINTNMVPTEELFKKAVEYARNRVDFRPDPFLVLAIISFFQQNLKKDDAEMDEWIIKFRI